jgi:RING-box protein 1
MTDVDMTDAPSASTSTPSKKSLGKSKAAVSEGGADGKKRFEVKKVRLLATKHLHSEAYVC